MPKSALRWQVCELKRHLFFCKKLSFIALVCAKTSGKNRRFGRNRTDTIFETTLVDFSCGVCTTDNMAPATMVNTAPNRGTTSDSHDFSHALVRFSTKHLTRFSTPQLHCRPTWTCRFSMQCLHDNPRNACTTNTKFADFLNRIRTIFKAKLTSQANTNRP